MKLRDKRASHPGYPDTGGPPRARAAPGTKTKKDLAKEAKEKKVKAKADGLKKIAMIERANSVAYANDETPRPTQTSSYGRKWPNAREPGNHRTVPSFKRAPELMSTASDTENVESLSDKNTDSLEEQPDESEVPSNDLEESEPPTDLEHVVEKKSKKGKLSVRTMIEDLKKGYDEPDEVDFGPPETPVVVQNKRLWTEAVSVSSYSLYGLGIWTEDAV